MKTKRFSMELAGLAAGFVFRDGTGAAAGIMDRYRKFRGGRKPDLLFEVRFRPGRRSPYRPSVAAKGNRVRLKRGDFDCLLDAGTGIGALKCRAAAQSFDSFLRTLYSRALLRGGGFILHSAGLVKNGKAYLFPGRSGAGKSTLARLAASGGAEVISDELNLVRFEKGELLKSPCAPFLKGEQSGGPGQSSEKGRFRVCGSPFWGEMRSAGRQGSWPLGGVFALKKAGANRLSPCPGPEALRLLLRCLVNFSRDPEDAALALENSARLLSKTGFSGLEFSKNNADFLNLV